MVSKQKIDREKVLAALNTLCPKCGYSIPPAEILRIDSKRMEVSARWRDLPRHQRVGGRRSPVLAYLKEGVS
jgi:hypothetical protein